MGVSEIGLLSGREGRRRIRCDALLGVWGLDLSPDDTGFGMGGNGRIAFPDKVDDFGSCWH